MRKSASSYYEIKGKGQITSLGVNIRVRVGVKTRFRVRESEVKTQFFRVFGTQKQSALAALFGFRHDGPNGASAKKHGLYLPDIAERTSSAARSPMNIAHC